MILYPTVVLLPQWVIDDITRAAAGPIPAHLFTDEMRSNGWTRDMLVGGVLLTMALRSAMDSA